MGSKLIWKDEYCIGNDTIDGEHKKLFELANKLFAVQASDNIVSEVRAIVVEVFDYMRSHFEHEEEYMKEISYAELDDQKEKHAEIIHQMNKILKSAEAFSELRFELNNIMRKWVLVHILEEDMKIVQPVAPAENEAVPTAENKDTPNT